MVPKGPRREKHPADVVGAPSGDQMSNQSTERIKADIHRALLEVAKRFEEDPTPTDGSFEAACKKLGIRSNVHVYGSTADKKRAR